MHLKAPFQIHDKGKYGPFAPTLNKVLESLAPNYINYNGYFNNPLTIIRLVQQQKTATHSYIKENLNEDQKYRLNKVLSYIEGFENAFGLEVLATVAYTVEQCPDCTKTQIIEDIYNWTSRKKELMSAISLVSLTKGKSISVTISTLVF